MSQPVPNMPSGASADPSPPSTTRTRYCATKGCKSRLARQSIDPHVLCVICRGMECDVQNRCKVCDSWSENAMLDYLSHLAKLEKKRAPKQPASQGAAASVSEPPAQDREPSVDRDALKEDIKSDLRSYLDRKMEESSAHVIREIKFLFKGMKSGRIPYPDDDDDDDDDGHPQEPAAEDPTYKSDSRYVDAKRLFDCGALDERALNNIILMCKADAARNVAPDPLFGPHDEPIFDNVNVDVNAGEPRI